MDYIKEIESLTKIANDIIENPNDEIKFYRIKIINYLTTLYRITWGGGAQELHDKVLHPCAGLIDKDFQKDETLKINDFNNQTQLDTILAYTLAYFNNYDYEQLNDIIIHLRQSIKYTKVGTIIEKDSEDFINTCDRLYELIKLMKMQLPRKRLFGRWFPQITFKI